MLPRSPSQSLRVAPKQSDPGASASDRSTVFEDSSHRLTRIGILKSWPEDYDAPSKTTLQRWFTRAERDGLVERNGKGRMNDPFKYSLPGFVPVLEELEPLQMHYR